METRELVVVDAFADEPLGGVPVPVVAGDSLSDTQLRAVAEELGAGGAVARGDDGLRYVEHTGVSAPVCAAVAGCVGLRTLDELDTGKHVLARANGEEYTAHLDSDRQVSVDVSETDGGPVSLDETDVADALGIERPAVRGMEDLPIARAGPTLVVPVTYLEHLGGASPEGAALGALFEETDTDRAFAFTFDTLRPDTDVHARVFTADGERAANGVAAAGCGALLARKAAFDGGRDQVQVESGRVLDRPATLGVTLAAEPRVTGGGLVAVEGTVTVPDEDDEEILEA